MKRSSTNLRPFVLIAMLSVLLFVAIELVGPYFLPSSWHDSVRWAGWLLLLIAFLSCLFKVSQRSDRLLCDLRQQVKTAEEQLTIVMDHCFAWEYWIDTSGELKLMSLASKQVSSYSRDELFHCPDLLTRMIHPDDRQLVDNHLQHGLDDPDSYQFDFRIIDNQGQVRWLAHSCCAVYDCDGNFAGRRVSNRNINQRIEAQQHLEHLTLHDSLTGLPNRTLLYDRLSQAIANHSRKNSRCGVLFVDLYKFKAVNLVAGYEHGDSLLAEIAALIGQQIRSSDTVARLGGDEFIVVLQELHHSQEAIRVARNIIRAIQHIDRMSKHRCGCNVGISLYPDHGDSADELITAADSAAIRAKEQGANTYVMFET